MTRLICTGRIVSFFGALCKKSRSSVLTASLIKYLHWRKIKWDYGNFLYLQWDFPWMRFLWQSVKDFLSVRSEKADSDRRTVFWIFSGIYAPGGISSGNWLPGKIQSIDHWIAFILLSLIGINMIRESGGEAENLDACFTFKAMLPLAVATSIDALAVGVTFAFLKVQIIPAVSFIGITTVVISCAGVLIGNRFGAKYKSKAEIAGGIVLILMGVKILLEHTILA